MLLPIAIGFVRYRHLTVAAKFLLYYLLICACIEAVHFTMATHNIRNVGIIHLVVLIQVITFSAIYYLEINSRKFRITLITLSSIYIVFLFIGVFITGLNNFNPYTKTAENIYFIGLSIYYFYYLSKELPIMHLEKFPMFWFNTGILLYFAGTVMLFALWDYYLNTAISFFYELWNIHCFLNVLINLFFSLTLWITHRKFYFRLPQ